MIPREQLPEDPADWGDVDVDFPQFDPNTAESCPISLAKVMEYVSLESADAGTSDPKSLQFLRTAIVGDRRCWVWAYTESDGELCYVTYHQMPDGRSILGLSSARPSLETDCQLTPEQFLLAEYYDLVYW